MVKNLPAVQETWVPSLGLEDPMEKGMATHFSILAWRIPWTQRGLAGFSPWDCKGSNTTEQLTHTHTHSFPGAGSFLRCLLILVVPGEATATSSGIRP